MNKLIVVSGKSGSGKTLLANSLMDKFKACVFEECDADLDINKIKNHINQCDFTIITVKSFCGNLIEKITDDYCHVECDGVLVDNEGSMKVKCSIKV